MKNLTKSYVYLSISGDNFDIDEFITLFNIKPTTTGTHRLGYNFLEYKIEANDIYEGLEIAIDQLAKVFSQKADIVKTYAIQKDLFIKVFVVIFKPKKDNDCGVVLSNDIIKFLYNIGAKIEVDMYNG